LKDDQGKQVADEGISELGEFPELLAGGDRIKIERINQVGNQGTLRLTRENLSSGSLINLARVN